MSLLATAEIEAALAQLPGWKLDGKRIQRHYEFVSFAAAMEFVNRVAAAAENADHHPDITISYTKVTLALTSHDVGGLTKRDVKMAQTIQTLTPPD